MRFALFAVVLVAVVCALMGCTQAGPTCTKSNTTYKTCESSTQPTCDNPRPMVVTADCRTGCFCKNGYVLNKSRDCVPVENCKK